MSEESWRADAACKGQDPNMFVLSKGADPSPAKQFCRQCEVRPECLQYAKDHKHVGIWGGVNFRQPGVPQWNTIQDARPKKIPEGNNE